jgi:hypothetical protein
MKPSSRDLEDLRHDHARWSTEHGHWTKDVRVWCAAHEAALELTAKVESLIGRFDQLAPRLRRAVDLHEEEVRLHSREIADAVPGSKHPGQALHRSGALEHARERDTYEELQYVHQQIVSQVAKLRDTFPALRAAYRATAREDGEHAPGS